MEVQLVRDDKTYTMSVEALPLHMERAEGEEEGTELEDTAYVLPGDEILPSDMLAIRAAPTEQLMTYLVEQEEI